MNFDNAQYFPWPHFLEGRFHDIIAVLVWHIAMVGLAYSLGGQWKKAEELEVQVMETRKRVLLDIGSRWRTHVSPLSRLHSGSIYQAAETSVYIDRKRGRIASI